MSTFPAGSLRIENVVASTKLGESLDLISLAAQIPSAEYNKKRFPGIVLRMEDPKIVALIFGSGKVVLTGAKSQEIVAKGLEKLVKFLRELNIDIIENPEYSIQNIVASADLETHINLNKIAMKLTLDKVEYEPEQFPGLVYRIDEPKVVVLLFGSGKLIITGAKSIDDAKRAVEKIKNDLKSFNLI